MANPIETLGADRAIPAPVEQPRLMIGIDKVLEIIPLSRQTLYRMESAGKFPASTYMSANRRAWYVDEVVAWQKNLPAHRRVSRRKAGSNK
jgi:predicted DNA-binding transcriptional regulator AlpA